MKAVLPNSTILIIDSDTKQAELISELVTDIWPERLRDVRATRTKVTLDSINSGAQALELISRSTYQLVIADCSVEDMDGISILERVKRVAPQTSVILISSNATIEEAVKAIRLGADEYLQKPFNPEHFKVSVQRCLEKRQLFNGDATVSSFMHLLNACQLISACLEEERVLETVLTYIKRETQAQALATFRYKNSKNPKDSKVSYIPIIGDINADVTEVFVEGHHFIQTCYDEKSPIKVFPKTSSRPEIAVFQFYCAAETPYFIVCAATHLNTTQEELDSRFRLLQAQTYMTGKTIQNYRGVKHLLYLDEPTGLYNTRYLQYSVDKLIEKSKKDLTLTPFSVLFLDIDKFKNVNDQFGHLIGTKLLYEMGQVMKHCIRASDLAFRYGGDEFVVILTSMHTQDAWEIAERLRSKVENLHFLSRENLNIHLTISIGVANYPEHATTKREIIEAADTAMYAAKRTTRNKVYIAEKKAA